LVRIQEMPRWMRGSLAGMPALRRAMIARRSCGRRWVGRRGPVRRGAGERDCLFPILQARRSCGSTSRHRASGVSRSCRPGWSSAGIKQAGKLCCGPEQIGTIVISLPLVVGAQVAFQQINFGFDGCAALPRQPAGRVAHGGGRPRWLAGSGSTQAADCCRR